MPHVQEKPRLAHLRILAFGSLLTCVSALVQCAGPQPLSVAITPADNDAYLSRLNAANYDGRRAYLNWMSDVTGEPVSTLVQRDALLSTHRNPFDAYRDFDAVSRGAVIYSFHCARCHGYDARGRGSSILPEHPAKDFHDFAHRFASTLHRGAPRKWFRVISDGYGVPLYYPDAPSTAMPPFGDKLTREQIWLVITYLQTLDMHAQPLNSRASGNSGGERSTSARTND